MAWAQLPVQMLPAGRKHAPATGAGMPELTEASGQWRVRGSAFEAAFDTATGTLVSYRFEGAELLRKGPEPTFWRAMTDNDQGSMLAIRSAVWRQAGQERYPPPVDEASFRRRMGDYRRIHAGHDGPILLHGAVYRVRRWHGRRGRDAGSGGELAGAAGRGHDARDGRRI